MDRPSRSTSATRSRSPRDSSSNPQRTIPDIFRPPARDTMRPAQATQRRSPSPHRPNIPLPSGDSNPPNPSDNAGHNTPIGINDLRAVAAEITSTLSAAIADIKSSIQSVTGRVEEMEITTARHEDSITQLQNSRDSYSLLLRDFNRHLEDLDNRGRRNNLRVRGVPESIDSQMIPQALAAIFNDLLGRPPETPVKMERAHRALRPRGRESDPPRDIICCITSFPLKEEILRNARIRQHLQYQGSEIRLFQDLSNITLQRRRELRPLLECLRARAITYRWKFPFGLSASNNGHTALLRVPEDLEQFCSTLNIPFIDLPDWYSEFRRQDPNSSFSMDGIHEAGDFHIRRRRAHPSSHTSREDPSALRPLSPTASPAHRRARHSPGPV